MLFIDHHEDEEQGGVLIPFGCCNPKVYGHLQVVYQQRLNVVDLVEYLPYLEF